MPDLVGIGSINVDVIVAPARADRAVDLAVDLGDPRLGLTPDDIGKERAVSPDRIAQALGYLSAFDPIVSPGGSALNLASSVAAASPREVTVGHIGVLGTRGPTGFDLPAWLDRLGVDTSLGTTVDGPPGMCLSINGDGQRTLLTTGGVNDHLGRHLARHHDRILGELATARLVHISSLAGLDDLGPLVGLVDRLRAGDDLPSGPTLSCDPGAIWTSPDRPPEADLIMGHCHQLLVNRQEAAALGEPDAIFERHPMIETVVVKGADRVDVHHHPIHHPSHHPIHHPSHPDGPATLTHPNPRVLTPDEIVDDTGSGDAFAAGFLLGQLTGLEETTAVTLGMDLARAKLGFVGVTGIETYADIWHRFDPHRPRR